MITRIIGYLLVFFISAYLFFMYDGNIWTGFLILELLYPVSSCLFLWYMGRQVTVRFGRFPAMAEREKRFSGVLVIKNQSRIWSVKYRLCAQVRNHFSRQPVLRMRKGGFRKSSSHRIKYAPSELFPAEEQRLEIELDSRYAGTVEYQLDALVLYDLLGIFCRRVLLKKQRTIGIMPPFELMPLEITRRTREFLAEADEYSTEKKGDDPSEVYQIREYRPPDSIHSIHWKLSAKEDHLMVKEHGFPMGCVVLLWIRLPLADTDSKSFNRLLEQAASLSVTLLEEKCIHMAAWFEEKSGRVIKWRVSTAESVYEWIWRLLSTEPFQDEELEKTCREDAFRGINFSSTVELNADGTLTVNGEPQELLQL
ncbi:DUF58 domain-containing protein [Lachnospiraceae bacterium]|jgi:hypothetical protein|nr:DUF58 domain-containing protein [uncultured Schaedlerella sp.]MCI9153071.1 DUF58 domain-containing protein [Ruminococcus sp.]NBI57372.1 DUF58 domain-containing protein [Lachnospiraceae bacterium]